MAKTYNLCFTFIIVLLIASVPFAQTNQNERREKFRGEISSKMNLSDEQEKMIAELRLNHQERLIDLGSMLKKSELQKKRLLQQDDLTTDEMLKITGEVSGIRNKIELERTRHQMDIYSLLNPDQKVLWKKLQLMRENRKDGVKRKFRENLREGLRERKKFRDQNTERL